MRTMSRTVHGSLRGRSKTHRGQIDSIVNRCSSFGVPVEVHRFLTSHCFICVPTTVTKAVASGAAAIPVAALAAPAFAMDSIVDALPSTALSLQVQFGAYLAVLLGTFLPALFLVNLYIQTETRKAGAEDALSGDEF